jgi:hypothetical protein
MNINLLVFLANIAIGIFGFGYYAYEFADIGIVGFFYAGNEIAILFFCLYYYVLTRISKENNKYILLIYALSFAIALLMATKTSVLSCVFLSFIDYYYRTSKKQKILLFISLLLIIIPCFIFFLPQTQFYKFVSSKFVRQLNNGSSLWDAILSGRADRVGPSYTHWKDNFSLIRFLFGMGFIAHAGGRVPVSSSFSVRRIEIDPLETFFYFGIILFLVLIVFYIYIIKLCLQKRNKKLFYFNMLFMVISFTAGHSWISVMAGVFFAGINAYELGKC